MSGKQRVQCGHCGLFGHKTTRSKKCLRYGQNFTQVDQNQSSKTDVIELPVNEDEQSPVQLGETELATMEVSLLDELPCTSGTCRDLEIDSDVEYEQTSAD